MFVNVIRVNLKGGLVYIVDVSVVEPSSQMYLLQESWKVENVANKLRENVKCIKYQHCRALQQEGGASLIPFVLEATGRLGPAAVEFMSKLNKENTLYASLFLDHMAAGLARTTGQMLNGIWRDHSRYKGISCSQYNGLDA